jgi:hypothetical protein
MTHNLCVLKSESKVCGLTNNVLQESHIGIKNPPLPYDRDKGRVLLLTFF